MPAEIIKAMAVVEIYDEDKDPVREMQVNEKMKDLGFIPLIKKEEASNRVYRKIHPNSPGIITTMNYEEDV